MNIIIKEKIVGNKPIFNISLDFIFALLYTIALGAVPGGVKNVIETPIAMGMTNADGLMLNTSASPIKTGVMIAAVAVFCMNCVAIIPKTTKLNAINNGF